MSILRMQLKGDRINYSDIPVSVEIVDHEFKTHKMTMQGTAVVDVEPGSYLVRAHLPSGETAVAMTDVIENSEAQVTLTPPESPHEWLSWLHFLGETTEPEEESTLRAFSEIWVRLWAYQDEFQLQFPANQQLASRRWMILPPALWLQRQMYDAGAASCWLYSANQPKSTNQSQKLYLRMLQVGGPTVPSRLVSLPPTLGEIQVLIRPSRIPTALNGGLTVKAVSQDLKAETLLHYLASGSLEAAQMVSYEVVADAEQMLRDKRINPMGAAIGGYYLLRVGALERLHDWPNNLANWITWLPDGAVIHAWQLLRQSVETEHRYARYRLLQACERGIPVYTEGVRLLIDGLEMFAEDATAHNRPDEEVEQALQRLRRYATAMDWNQRLTTFYGIDPETPSLQPSPFISADPYEPHFSIPLYPV